MQRSKKESCLTSILLRDGGEARLRSLVSVCAAPAVLLPALCSSSVSASRCLLLLLLSTVLEVALRSYCACCMLLVFDFDLTLLRIHAWFLKVTPEQALERPLSDFADLPLFQAFVAAAKRRGDQVAVASFGCSETILVYLERACPGAFSSHNVLTPSFVGVPDGTCLPDGKDSMLRALSERFLGRSDAFDQVRRSREINRYAALPLTGSTGGLL